MLTTKDIEDLISRIVEDIASRTVSNKEKVELVELALQGWWSENIFPAHPLAMPEWPRTEEEALLLCKAGIIFQAVIQMGEHVGAMQSPKKTGYVNVFLAGYLTLVYIVLGRLGLYHTN